MICPYCNEEMFVWYLTSMTNIYLSDEKRGFFLKGIGGKRIDANETTSIHGGEVKVYRCFNCTSDKLIIDLSETTLG